MLGPVRLVTVQTVFPNRRMFPEERTSLFRVTGITIFIGGILRQKFGSRAPVRVMTVGADHLTLAERHMRGTHILRFPELMTLKAGFQLVSARKQFFVLRVVHAVTGQTRNRSRFVRAPFPKHPLMIRMTLETSFRSGPRAHLLGIFYRGKIRIGLVAGRSRVQRPGPVTSFTGLFKRNLLNRRQSLGVKILLKTLDLIRMTAHTGRCAHLLRNTGLRVNSPD